MVNEVFMFRSNVQIQAACLVAQGRWHIVPYCGPKAFVHTTSGQPICWRAPTLYMYVNYSPSRQHTVDRTEPDRRQTISCIHEPVSDKRKQTQLRYSIRSSHTQSATTILLCPNQSPWKEKPARTSACYNFTAHSEKHASYCTLIYVRKFQWKS